MALSPSAPESAWSAPIEVFDFIKQKFPSIEMYLTFEKGPRYNN